MISGCAKQNEVRDQMMQKITGEYDVVKIVNGVTMGTNGPYSYDNVEYCTGVIDQVSDEQFKFQSGCESFDYYYSLDEFGELRTMHPLDFTKGELEWDGGVLVISTNNQEDASQVFYEETIIYAVKESN